MITTVTLITMQPNLVAQALRQHPDIEITLVDALDRRSLPLPSSADSILVTYTLLYPLYNRRGLLCFL